MDDRTETRVDVSLRIELLASVRVDPTDPHASERAKAIACEAIIPTIPREGNVRVQGCAWAALWASRPFSATRLEESEPSTNSG